MYFHLKSFLTFKYSLLIILVLCGCSDEYQLQAKKLLQEHKIIATEEKISGRITKQFSWGSFVKKDKQYYLADTEGNILNPTGFKSIKLTKNSDLILVESKKKLKGLIDRNGQVVAKTIYRTIKAFGDDGLAIIEYGTPYTDKQGLELLRVRKGLINSNGEVVVKPEYFHIDYQEKAKIYKINHYSYRERNPGRTSLFSATQGWIPNASFESLGHFEEGLSIIKNNSKSGMINEKLDIIIPPIYKSVFKIQDGLIKVTNDKNQTAFFNQSGTLAIPFRNYNPSSFSNGLSIVHSHDSNFTRSKIALMNKSGTLVTDYRFSRVEPFSFSEDHNQYFSVASPLESVYNGLINMEGEFVIEPIFRKIESDRKGYFATTLYDAQGSIPSSERTFRYLVNLEGNVYISAQEATPTYKKPENIHKIGILDQNLNVISEPIFDDVRVTTLI